MSTRSARTHHIALSVRSGTEDGPATAEGDEGWTDQIISASFVFLEHAGPFDVNLLAKARSSSMQAFQLPIRQNKWTWTIYSFEPAARDALQHC